MDEEVVAYKATSTNQKGHEVADQLYAHYSKLKKGAPAADFDFYISAGTCLAEGLLSREDCEGALSTALAIEDKVRNTGYG